MAQTNTLTTPPINPALLIKPMSLGAGIALILISIFLFTGGAPNPAWGKFWMIQPLIIVPLAGATGGACYYFITHFLHQGPWKKALAIILSLLVYIIGLWLGTVLGLSGTYWN